MEDIFGTALAKPSGISLYAHTERVLRFATETLDTWPFLARKYARLTNGSDLRELLKIAAYYHDLGKKFPSWQDACQAEYDKYVAWLTVSGHSTDQYDADLHKYYENTEPSAGTYIRQARLRHEIASLYYVDKREIALSPVVRVAIAAHHAKLGDAFKKRWLNDPQEDADDKGLFRDLWKEMKHHVAGHGQLTTEDKIRLRFRYDAARALLRLADTRASREEQVGEKNTVPLTAWESPQGYGPNAVHRPVQLAALAAADRIQTILRAPTGSGKTYAAFLWADHQIKHDRADRLVIAMLTRFTSNALAISAIDQMEDVGLYHSSAFYNRYGSERKNGEYQELHKLSRLLAYPTNVCTIDHLLICLTGAREDHHSTFYFLANSCVVFDEVDFYDPFVQANLKQLLAALKILKVPVLVMSATVPDSARLFYGFDDPIVSADQTAEQGGVSKHLHYAGAVDQPGDADDVLDKMIERGQGIIYANTVKRALCYYYYLQKKLKEVAPDLPLVIYHSRYTEPDKKDIEAEVLKALGKDAHDPEKAGEASGIVILTQIGEMSINVSAPLMLTDACPWDRLSQRVGRLGRFRTGGNVHAYVVEPQEKEKLYPPPYGSYDKEKHGWLPADALVKSLDDYQKLPDKGAIFTPQYLVDRVNETYPTVENLSTTVEVNVTNYRQCIKNYWCILPNLRVDEDEGQVDSGIYPWTARDIGPQVTVVVNQSDHSFRFRNWGEYQDFLLENGISCPFYQVDPNRYRAQPSVVKQVEVTIGTSDDDRNSQQQLIWVSEANTYDKQLGFIGLYGYTVKGAKDQLF